MSLTFLVIFKIVFVNWDVTFEKDFLKDVHFSTLEVIWVLEVGFWFEDDDNIIIRNCLSFQLFNQIFISIPITYLTISEENLCLLILKDAELLYRHNIIFKC